MGTDIHGVLQVRQYGKWWTECDIHGDRNYTLFAVLADVRNRYDLTPISEPRGWPEDFECKEWNHESNSMGDRWLGDHSFSWLSVRELLEWSGWDVSIQYEDKAIPLRESCGVFLAWLNYASAIAGEDEARIVFGFDS